MCLEGGGALFGSSYREGTPPVCFVSAGPVPPFPSVLSPCSTENNPRVHSRPQPFSGPTCHIRDIYRFSRVVASEILDLDRVHMKS
jgi:hypothetical protein